jgi:hypothetical protein
MNCKELRIGNYVCVTEKHPLKVKIINDEDAIMSTVSDNSPYITAASLLAFKPIPLTEEWLLKFGFDRVNEKEGNPFKKDFITIDYFSFRKGWCIFPGENISFNPINYVHQLQNLYFALTGEELKIINHGTK